MAQSYSQQLNGKYDEAVQPLQQALEGTKERPGPKQLVTLEHIRRCVLGLSGSGNHKQAASLSQQALRTWERREHMTGIAEPGKLDAMELMALIFSSGFIDMEQPPAWCLPGQEPLIYWALPLRPLYRLDNPMCGLYAAAEKQYREFLGESNKQKPGLPWISVMKSAIQMAFYMCKQQGRHVVAVKSLQGLSEKLPSDSEARPILLAH
eukprot:scaffold236696_cov18-Tisochrysis_lutea.AAC.1